VGAADSTDIYVQGVHNDSTRQFFYGVLQHYKKDFNFSWFVSSMGSCGPFS
jgi:hypothetical protein